MTCRLVYLRSCPLCNLIVSHAVAAVVKNLRGWRLVASCNGARCLRLSLAAICLLTLAASIAQSEESAAPSGFIEPFSWPAGAQTALPRPRWWALGYALDGASTSLQ